MLVITPETQVLVAFAHLSRHDQGMFLSLDCRHYNNDDAKRLELMREHPTEGLDSRIYPTELQLKWWSLLRQSVSTWTVLASSVKIRPVSSFMQPRRPRQLE